MRKYLFLAALALCALAGVECSYMAAVVEHHPVNLSSPNLTIEENVKLYVRQIELAKNSGVQIIVFPEYGLTGLQLDPSNYSLEVPETGATDFYNNDLLKRFSNAASEHQMYIVMNLLERSKDHKNRTVYYNTNVVFDKMGTLIAKYRKINLFNEPNLLPGNEIVTFQTDFGVTFGLMTCFDILFYNPSRTLLNKTTNIVYPHAWNSLLPFYMSLSVQFGYSRANRVNLLAANLNNPSIGMGGSGIYFRDDSPPKYLLTDKPATNMVTANVDSSFSTFGFEFLDNNETRLANYNAGRAFDENDYTFRTLDLKNEHLNETLCDGKFCCHFNIEVFQNETNVTEYYRALVFNGRAPFGSGEASVKLCTVVACSSSDVKSCGYRPQSPLATKFRHISVSGEFPEYPEHFYQPTSLKSDLTSVFNVSHVQTKTSKGIRVVTKTTGTEQDLIAFGIYGRGGSNALSGSVLLLLIAAFSTRLIFN